jgi:hypothetical protein
MVDTAFVKDAKGWTFAEDSRISKAHEKDIVVSDPFHQGGMKLIEQSRQAYMLYVSAFKGLNRFKLTHRFYKRVR